MSPQLLDRCQANRPDDQLRDLQRGCLITDYDEAGTYFVITAKPGHDIERVLASLRADGYLTENRGPNTGIVYV